MPPGSLGFWSLLRYQTRLCRWSWTTRTDATWREVPRWLGRIRIGRRSHHALLCPPASRRVPVLGAPAFPSRGVVRVMRRGPAERERRVLLTVRMEGSSAGADRRLRLDPGALPGADGASSSSISAATLSQIELTLKTTVSARADADTRAIWGEPDSNGGDRSVKPNGCFGQPCRQALRGRPLSAARTLHGRFSGTSYPPLYHLAVATGLLEESLARNRRCPLPYRPLVSVVTPVYNTDARWLRACIESVKRQAYPNWQFCLADDGSTREETRDVLREYQGDPRIRIQDAAAQRRHLRPRRTPRSRWPTASSSPFSIMTTRSLRTRCSRWSPT